MTAYVLCRGPLCLTMVPGGGLCHYCRRSLALAAGRPVCGAWMPLTDEPCARRPGHVTDVRWPRSGGHRSAYALANQRDARAAA